MKANKIYNHLSRMAEYGDAISKNCKSGANISIGEGGLILTNDVHSVLVHLEHKEFNEKVAFKSHLFPEAKKPLILKQKEGSVDFSWKEKSMKKKVNVNTCRNLYDEGKKVFDEKYNLNDSFNLPTSVFKAIDLNIHVLKVEKNEKGIIFEQTTTTGEEIFKTEIPLKFDMGGIFSGAGVDETQEDAETIVSTIEFQKLPILTDENMIELAIVNGGAIFSKISMGSLNAKVIVSPMKYER